jgi:hypothetical protein
MGLVAAIVARSGEPPMIRAAMSHKQAADLGVSFFPYF